MKLRIQRLFGVGLITFSTIIKLTMEVRNPEFLLVLGIVGFVFVVLDKAILN